MLPLADGLAAAGHRVSLTVRDRATGLALLGGRDLPLLPAPILPTGPINPTRIESYADILLNAGYTDPIAVGAIVARWLDLLRAHRIDLLVAEFASRLRTCCNSALGACPQGGRPFVGSPVGLGCEHDRNQGTDHDR